MTVYALLVMVIATLAAFALFSLHQIRVGGAVLILLIGYVLGVGLALLS